MRSWCTNWYLWHWSLEPFGHNRSWIYVSSCPLLWLQSLNSKMVRFLFNFERLAISFEHIYQIFINIAFPVCEKRTEMVSMKKVNNSTRDITYKIVHAFSRTTTNQSNMCPPIYSHCLKGVKESFTDKNGTPKHELYCLFGPEGSSCRLTTS